MSGRTVEQLSIPGGRGLRLIDHDDIESGQFRLVLPKRLPDNAFDPVSACGLPAVLFRYRKTQPRDVRVILPAKYRKPFVPAARRFFEHAPERRGIK